MQLFRGAHGDLPASISQQLHSMLVSSSSHYSGDVPVAVTTTLFLSTMAQDNSAYTMYRRVTGDAENIISEASDGRFVGQEEY
jgi:hypothetical protein